MVEEGSICKVNNCGFPWEGRTFLVVKICRDSSTRLACLDPTFYSEAKENMGNPPWSTISSVVLEEV